MSESQRQRIFALGAAALPLALCSALWTATIDPRSTMGASTVACAPAVWCAEDAGHGDHDELMAAEAEIARAVAAWEGGDWPTASAAVDRARERFERGHGGRPHLDLVGCEGIAARIHLAAGEAGAARDRFERAVALFERLAADGPRPEFMVALRLLADLAEELDRRAIAADLLLLMERHRRDLRLAPDAEHVAALGDAIRLLRSLDRDAESIPLLLALLEHHRASPSIVSDGRIESILRTIADVHATVGDEEAHLAALESIVAHRRARYGGDDAHIVAALVDLGDALIARERFDDALAAFAEAMEMRTRLATHDGVRTDAWALAETINNVAVALVAIGRPADAIPLHEDALAMRRRLARGEDNRLVASSMDNLAASLNRVGRSREAIAVGHDALAMLRRLVGAADDPDVATVLNNLAAAHYAAGRLDLSLPLQQESVEMRLRVDGDAPSRDGIMSMVNLALALHLASRSADASLRVDRALAMLDRMPAGTAATERAAVLQVAASIRMAFGRSDEALLAMREAIELTRSLHGGDHPALAGLLVDMAISLGELGRHDDAMDALDQALPMLRRTHGDVHPDLATALLVRATQESALGDPGSAQRSVAESLVILDAAYEDDADVEAHPLILECLDRLAVIANELGDRATALDLSRQAAERAVARELPGAMRMAANHGWLLIDADRLDDAEPWLRVAADRQESHLWGIGGTEVERLTVTATFGGLGASQGLAWIEALRGNPEAAIVHLERDRSRTLRGLLERGRRSAYGGLLGPLLEIAERQGDETLRDDARALEIELAEATAAMASADRESLQRARERHAAVRRRALSLLDSRVVSGLEPASVSQLQRALGPGDVILIYLISSHAGVVFAVGHADGPIGEVQQHGLVWPDGGLVTAHSLRDAIGRHLSGIFVEGRTTRGIGRERPMENRVGAAASYRLMRGLIPEPLWDALRTARVVHVVPDAAMHRLPFETLLIEPPSPGAAATDRVYWIDGGPMLSYAPSAAVLVDRAATRDRQRIDAARRPPSAELLAVGDPIFARPADQASPQLGPLPGTRTELEAIIGAICASSAARIAAASDEPIVSDGVIALLGESATSETLRDFIARLEHGPRILHLATHGIVESGANALQSRLALTVPRTPSPTDTGALSLLDLLDGWSGRLAATELVVLSACDSVGGDSAGQNLRSGEGIFGLPWGFMYAGAPTVIASLWEVDDESTALLMGHFYRELLRPRDMDDPALDPSHTLRAFTSARRALRTTHPDPFHWGPFVLMGSPE